MHVDYLPVGQIWRTQQLGHQVIESSGLIHDDTEIIGDLLRLGVINIAHNPIRLHDLIKILLKQLACPKNAS